MKQSLSTFLKFWLMGGCGAEGWAGTDELEAEHSPSGTKASIRIDVEQGTVSLISPSAPSAGGIPELSEYAIALLDELEKLACTEEAAAADRLCYPPEAASAARLKAWAYCAPRGTADTSAGSGSAGDAGSDGGRTEDGYRVRSILAEFEVTLMPGCGWRLAQCSRRWDKLELLRTASSELVQQACPGGAWTHVA